MIYAAFFVVAVFLGWLASYKWGGTAERETMCILTCIWVGTIIANIATHSPAPVEFYAVLDLSGIVWLWRHQRRNWQWVPAALFGSMLFTHLMFYSGTHSGEIIYSGRPYQDILAGLAYLQIASTGWASYERSRAKSGGASRSGHWALASNWLPRQRNHNRHHAEPRG